MSRFEVEQKDGGMPWEHRIVVDGVEISEHVSRFVFDAPMGELPRLILEGTGDGTISEKTGVVMERLSDRVAIVEFLANIDAGTLEEKAMGRIGFDGDSTTPTEAMLKQLMDWASGN